MPYRYIHPRSSSQSVNRTCVKIDGRQQQEENIAALLNRDHVYTRRTYSELQVQYIQETNTKLGGMVLYGGIHPNYNAQFINCIVYTCEN